MGFFVWVRKCCGNYVFPFLGFAISAQFPCQLQHFGGVFATFWSSNLSFSIVFAIFWCSNFSCCMVFCDQGSFKIGLRLFSGLFRVGFRLVQNQEAKKQRSREKQKSRKEKSLEAEQWRSREVKKQRSRKVERQGNKHHKNTKTNKIAIRFVLGFTH